jgi:protein involved in polysaccharide export with SLBB domain
MRVVELIAKAGDVSEFANRENIRITRVVNGKDVSLQFNYKDFMKGKQKALEQNIPLRPGDIVTVP